MRPVVLGIALAGVALFGLGLFVMLEAPADGPGDGAIAASGLRPQGHVYTSAAERPADINPLTCRGVAAQNLILRVTHDALLDRDARTGELRPALAVAHEPHADGLGCTYRLREDVRFADGSKVVGDDVLFAWQLHRAGFLTMGAVGDALQLVEHAQLDEDGRLVVRFARRHFAAASTVGEGWLVVHKRFFVDRVRSRLADGEAMPDVGSKRFAELLDHVDFETGPGTGPYQLAGEAGAGGGWQSSGELVLSRNDGSWRRAARPGSWNFAAMKILFVDQAGARNAVLRHEVDWYSGPDIDRLLAAHPTLADHYVRRVYDYPQLGVYRIVWNCRRQPYDDARVRRALAHLVDRPAVVRSIGAAVAAAAHAKPHAEGHGDVAPAPFDPARARRELGKLSEAGVFASPLTLSLLALDGTDALRGIVALLRDAARKAGIDLQVRQLAFAPFLAAMKEPDWDGLLVMQSFEATGDPFRFLHSEGSANYGHWSHPEADRLATEARACLDDAHRSELWRRLHRLAADQQPACLIAHPQAVVLIDRALTDFEPGAYGLRPEWAWVAPAQQRRR